MLPRVLSGEKAPDCEVIAGEVINYWRTAVSEHLAGHPLDECSGKSALANVPAVQVRAEEPYVAYGTTILAVAVVEEGLFLLQIGDGDILIVSPTGDVSRPLPPDQRLFANETTSLCSKTAAADCRVLWIPNIGGELPSLVMLTTDGYPNSFRQESGFLKAASDLCALIAEEGRTAVEKELEGWLDETSSQGSGDDITIALLYAEVFPLA